MEEEREEHRLDNLMPVRVNDKLKLAEIMLKSGFMPTALDTPQKIFIALQMGHELGLSPMISVNNISAIHNKPVVSADLLLAVARRHPDFAGMETNSKPDGCTVTVYRRRRGMEGVDTFTHTFTAEDAKRAGLADKPVYKQYPQRMYKHRAMAYVCRDAFPDATAGIYTKEEIENVDDDIKITATVKEQPNEKSEPRQEEKRESKPKEAVKKTTPPKTEKKTDRQKIIDAIGEVVCNPIFTDAERAEARKAVEGAKELPSLKYVLEVWEKKLQNKQTKIEPPDDEADIDAGSGNDKNIDQELEIF